MVEEVGFKLFRQTRPSKVEASESSTPFRKSKRNRDLLSKVLGSPTDLASQTLPIFPNSLALFETNIRFVGGLLAAYELTGKTNQKLIDQAKTSEFQEEKPL